MSQEFLRLENVTKAYSGKVAVNDVSFGIPRGSIFGLLGPNGAGKTSMIRMITGITAPDKGKILFDGEPLSPAHIARTGYMPEERGLYKKMKVREHLIYLLRLKDCSLSDARTFTDKWMEKLGMSDWANKKIQDLSKGMQQKVQFVATVAHGPSLLILDEPFSGLDPINTKLIEDEIRDLKKNGSTIIFSTHRMEQVEELCEHIALINEGRLLLQDEVRTVRRKHMKPLYHLEYSGDSSLLQSLTTATASDVTPHNATLTVKTGMSPGNLLTELAGLPLEIIRFELHLPRLQEIFIDTVKNAPVYA